MEYPKKIWIVTRLDEDEPIVTPFDNQEAAEKCKEYFEDVTRVKVIIDESEIFTSFEVFAPATKEGAFKVLELVDIKSIKSRR